MEDTAAVEPVHALVVASAPLLRVGLERAALAAGLQLVNPPVPAVIGLHSGSDIAPAHAPVNISVGANQATIALTAVPDHGTWTAIWRLLRELFDPVAESP